MYICMSGCLVVCMFTKMYGTAGGTREVVAVLSFGRTDRQLKVNAATYWKDKPDKR